MIRSPKNGRRRRKWLLVLALLLAVLTVSGCETLGFYTQAIKGQYQMIAHQRPVEKVLADPRTPPRLKEQLQLLQNLLAFAGKDLKLVVDGQYRKYADLHRPYAVWNVEAAPEFSLEPKAWWYPLVGSLEYRGYFSQRSANAYADRLRARGYDVYTGGVEAYSTLGWFKDPILNTFIFNPEPDLAEVIFHELSHQRVFAHGDTDFNEAFATTVGQEGARRWLAARSDSSTYASYLSQLQRTDQFVHLIMNTRAQLEELYGDERTAEGKIKAAKKHPVPTEQLRQEKLRIMDRLQQDYAQLKAQWGGGTGYDNWFGRQVNNAQLNSVAAYYDLVPGFQRLLESNGGDLEKFYQAADKLAKKPKKERQQSLRTMGAEEKKQL